MRWNKEVSGYGRKYLTLKLGKCFNWETSQMIEYQFYNITTSLQLSNTKFVILQLRCNFETKFLNTV